MRAVKPGWKNPEGYETRTRRITKFFEAFGGFFDLLKPRVVLMASRPEAGEDLQVFA